MTDEMPVEAFVEQVRFRSAENRKAIHALVKVGALGSAIAVIRQELDSLIRVVYLLNQTFEVREELARDSVSGRIWKAPNGKGRVTDREMVEIATRLGGWVKRAYDFGCSAIHLSSLHSYRAKDPFLALAKEDREDIIEYLRYYHSGPNTDNPAFGDLIPFLPKVFEKIRSNVDFYLEELIERKLSNEVPF